MLRSALSVPVVFGVVFGVLAAVSPSLAAPPLVAFQPRATFGVGPSPVSLVVADVSRDGKLDLIVGDNSLDGVSLLLGRGDGTFQARRRFGSVYFVRSLFVVDASLNGTPDIVAQSGQYLGFLENRGGGNFNSAVFSNVQGLGSLTLGDFDRDGKLDFVAGSALFGSVGGFGNGKGDFSRPLHPGLQGFVEAITAADLDRDGILDLIRSVQHGDPAGVAAFRGKGDGTFTLWPILGSIPSAATVAADLNFDSRPDLVVFGGGQFSVYLNKLPSPFAAPISLPTDRAPTSVVVADVNRDGKPDLVVSEFGENAVSIYGGNGDGTFRQRQSFAAGDGPRALSVADVNADGLLDVVVTNQTNTVSVLLGKGP